MKTSRSREILIAYERWKREGNYILDAHMETTQLSIISDFLSTLKDTEEALPVPSQGEAERAIGFVESNAAQEFAEWSSKSGWTYLPGTERWINTKWYEIYKTTPELFSLYLTTQSTAK